MKEICITAIKEHGVTDFNSGKFLFEGSLSRYMTNYSKIKKWSIENGKGIRTSIFFSGCEFSCKGCFNKELWSFSTGKPFSREVYENEIKPTINEHIDGISILGGEAFHPKNIEATSDLINWFSEDFPNKTIWCWTGYTWEELMYRVWKGDDTLSWVIAGIDVLVDGRFIEEQKDLSLKWCGSRNQRVIDVKKSLEKGEIVLYE